MCVRRERKRDRERGCLRFREREDLCRVRRSGAGGGVGRGELEGVLEGRLGRGGGGSMRMTEAP